MPIIEVKHLTKEYELGAVSSIKDTLRHTLAKIQGKGTWQREQFKALDDVSFSIEEGEVVGIIGHNGAGKSTLLKHLANITKPTSGEVIVRGSIAPLIEVGAGVNPELTGRENIFLNGAILGIPKKVIQSKVDEIIEFSELEQFIDTPVKRYSSGMTVKLGFSIATSMDADILIIDEVLAVGDLAFQRKCFDRMENLIKKQGKTVLLVSHNIRQIERICSRVLMLKHGGLAADNEPKMVCNRFYEESDQKIQEDKKTHISSEPDAQLRGTGEVSLIELGLLDQSGRAVESVNNNDRLTVELTFEVHDHIVNPVFAIGFHTVDMLYIATPRSQGEIYRNEILPGIYTVTCHINAIPLLPGVYALRVSISEGEIPKTILYAENLCHFSVSSTGFDRSLVSSEGFISIPCTWDINHTKPLTTTDDNKDCDNGQ